MAIIKCPECGGTVSDTCDFCIHCGYALKPKNDVTMKENQFFQNSKSENQNNDEMPVLLERYRHGLAMVDGIFGAAFGSVLFVVFTILGAILHTFFFINAVIFLISIPFGILEIGYYTANKHNKYDIAYYDKSQNKIIIYNAKSDKFCIDTRDIILVKRYPYDNVAIFYSNNGKKTKIECGYSTKEKINDFKNFIKDNSDCNSSEKDVL